MATEFSVEEAQQRLAELLDRAGSGEQIVITRLGATSISLRPVHDRQPALGVAHGAVGAMWLAPDFGDSDDISAKSTFDIGTDYWPSDGLDFSG